jgi:hypothetical protein
MKILCNLSFILRFGFEWSLPVLAPFYFSWPITIAIWTVFVGWQIYGFFLGIKLARKNLKGV